MSFVNLGLLTTTFTAPATCSSLTLIGGNVCLDCGLPTLTSLACPPNGFNAWNFYPVQYYLLGICPQGWTLAPSTVASDYSASNGVTLAAGETMGLCCPSNF